MKTKYYQLLWILSGLVHRSMTGITATTDCPSQCQCEAMTLECYKAMPDFLPQSITRVIIHETHIYDKLNFSDPFWANVTYLSINPKVLVWCTEAGDGFRTLHKNEFIKLQNLKYLQVACTGLDEIEENAFYGLNNLKVLDLSNNPDLNLKWIAPGLRGEGILPDLTELLLSNVSNLEYGFDDDDGLISIKLLTVFDPDFVNSVKDKPIKVLDLSQNRFISYQPHVPGFINLPEAFQSLEKLNISTIGYPTADTLLGFNLTIKDTKVPEITIFQNLKVLDISNNLLSFPGYENFILPVSHNLKDLYVNKLVKIQVSDKDFENNMIKSPVKLQGSNQYFAFKKEIKYFCLQFIHKLTNLFLCYPEAVKLNKLFVAENSINEIEKTLWHNLQTLYYLDMSKNQLGGAFSKDDKTECMFCILRNLRVLVLSENGIYKMQENTFKTNKDLRVLDLSRNKLESIPFKTDNLISLEKLDISHNSIHVMDTSSVMRLNHLQIHNHNNDTQTNEIILTGNPFSCTCENVAFFNWMLTLNSNYTCGLGLDKKHVNTFVIRHIQYTCKEPIIIAVFSTFALLVTLIITLLVYLLVQERRRYILREKIKRGINMFAMIENHEQYPPVFLSFSSTDEEIVMDYIFPHLDAGLKRILDTDTRCVATGCTDFRPGFPLANEIIRCIEASSVVICFVTNAYCDKMWCQNESLVAYNENKPLILMMWENVDPDLMPKHLSKHFQQYVRVHWVQDNGASLMKPDWDKLCESIVAHFATNV